MQITPPGFAAPDLHGKTESPKHKTNPQTLTVLPQDIPSHLPSPASQESPRLPSGASKLWQQWIHAHVQDGLSCAFRLLFYPQVSKAISEEIPF